MSSAEYRVRVVPVGGFVVERRRSKHAWTEVCFFPDSFESVTLVSPHSVELRRLEGYAGTVFFPV